MKTSDNKDGKLKAYEKMGLTKSEVVKMQQWIFPMIDKTESISEMIKNVVDEFEGTKLHYALYVLGNEMGQAGVKERLGMAHVLNPENV